MRLILPLCWLFIIGCATINSLPGDHSISKTLLLPFRIDSITITDFREDSITTEMDIVFSAREQEWKIIPALEDDLQKEIIEMINSASNPEGLPATLNLFITKQNLGKNSESRKG